MFHKSLFFLFLFVFANSVSAQKKIPIAVIDLNSEGITSSQSRIISSRLRLVLFNTNNYTIVEREKMKEILGEQGFQLTGCTSNECVVEAGKVLGVSQIIAGDIGKIGSLYTLSIRLIDVQTGKILKMANVDCECRIEKVLTTSVRNVVERLLGKKERDHQLIKNEPQIFPDTVTDIDGNVYKTVKIGSQVWMAENLKVTRYRNGDPIPNVAGKSEWKNLGTGACCNYDNNSSNAAAYGRLYNWYAVNDSRNIAPAGWHVPTEKEWQTLIDYLGGEAVAGGKMKERGTAHWKRPNSGATNSSGFSALPGGYRYSNGSFSSIGTGVDYWSATGGNSGYAWGRYLHYSTSDIGRSGVNEQDGFSVRCVRD